MPVRERSHFQLNVCVLLSYDEADNVFDVPSLDCSFVHGNKLVSTLYLTCDQQNCVSRMRSDVGMFVLFQAHEANTEGKGMIDEYLPQALAGPFGAMPVMNTSPFCVMPKEIPIPTLSG